MAAVIEVEDLPPTDRIDVLRSHMLQAPVPLELRPMEGVDLHAKSRVADIGGIHLLSTSGSGATVIRTPRLARDATEPSLMVSVLVAGTSVVFQGDRLMRLERGSIAAYVTTAPYWSTFQSNTVRHSFQFRLSQLALPDRAIASQLTVPLTAQRLLTETVVSHLSRIARSGTTLTAGDGEALEQPTLDLIRSLLALNGGNDHLARGPLSRTLSTRAFEFARLHLTDRGLGAPMIAAALGVSERHVYAIFRASGSSLGEWIRERRIDTGADLLARSAPAHSSIAAIAHHLGFADHAHFTRTFRELRGMTPSEWRRIDDIPGTPKRVGS